jgi:hypothetical protein
VKTHAQTYVDRLVAELRERGLRVSVKLPDVTVKDPGLSGQDRHGQQIRIQEEKGGAGLTWWWVWPAPRPALRGEPTPPPELEPLCPAENIDTAADRITKVVRLSAPERLNSPAGAGPTVPSTGHHLSDQGQPL